MDICVATYIHESGYLIQAKPLKLCVVLETYFAQKDKITLTTPPCWATFVVYPFEKKCQLIFTE